MVIELPLKIFFKGQPLKKELVKFWRKLENGTIEIARSHTNNHGEVTMSLLFPGNFMVSCVHMERNTSDTTSQWRSYWGSLTFGEKGNFFVKRRIKAF